MRKYEMLLVDDDPLVLDSIGTVLENKGNRIITAENGKKALELLDKEHFDLVISDLVMDEVDGIKVLKKAKNIGSDIKVIILTAYGSMTSTIDALRLGADDFLLKPCEPEEIIFRVNRCLEQLELERKIKLYENILPMCCVCKKVRDDTGKEPGTGKWLSMDQYIRNKTKIDISHAYCPDCAKNLWAEIP